MGLAAYAVNLFDIWFNGLWSLLAFTMQMVMILVLGHVIALSPLVSRLIFRLIQLFKNQAQATTGLLVCTLLVAFFNWGLGLIFGAVMARKLGEYAAAKNWPLNYPLAGAAGYAGLMIWHGGISGSAPLSVAAPDHFLFGEIGVISSSETIFSLPNLLINAALVVVLALVVWWLARRSTPTQLAPNWNLQATIDQQPEKYKANLLMLFFGGIMLLISVFELVKNYSETGDFFAALSLNFVNFLLFGLAFLLMGNMSQLEKAAAEASYSVSGILLQFPLYAGIMALMAKSGLLEMMAGGFIAISNEHSFSLLTLISASVVNLFVPSGGGQWAVQGPVIVEAAQHLGVAIPKSIMALAYGDELTNMIQPFWALPLLGITKLRASELLPYTFKLMLVGFVVYALGLLLW